MADGLYLIRLLGCLSVSCRYFSTTCLPQTYILNTDRSSIPFFIKS